jgi:SPP1 family predicted phage head-tail adaptor
MPARGAGTLDQRITIQQKTRTEDTQGGGALTWSTLDAVAAEVVPIRATEQLANATIGSYVDTKFKIRSRSDVTPKMRVLWRPSWETSPTLRTMEIHGVVPDLFDTRRYTVLECGEVV